MTQSRRGSFLESIANVLIGYLVAIAGQMVVFPLLGIVADTRQNLLCGLCFSFISILRSYCIRRLFNGIKS